MPSGATWAAYLVAFVVLGLVVSGFFPAILAFPFAYITFGVTVARTLVDGGDQVALVLSVVLVPYSICGWRRSVWSRKVPTLSSAPVRVAIAEVFSAVLRVQVSVIYLVACISKLSTDAWPDGSALWYWLRVPSFGAPNWLTGLLLPISATPVPSAIATWGALVLEFSLGVSMLMPKNVRLKVLLLVGLLMHLAILFAMGIASFSIAMFGALLFLLIPPTNNWQELGKRPIRPLIMRRLKAT